MKSTTFKPFILIYLLAGTLSLAACGGGGGGTPTVTPTPPVDTTPPTLSSQSPTIRTVSDGTSISFVFDESMDTANFSLAGILASESNGGVWSTTTIADDTLTVSPASTWSINTNRDLTANVQDVAGNSIAVNVVYDVYRGTLFYVDGSQVDDNGDGLSPATARQFIHTAVADATAPATILVNAGAYNASNVDAFQIVLKDGVSLYGGFSADFVTRDPANNTTTIEDLSTTPAASSPSRAIEGDGAITNATSIDGFTIQAARSLPDGFGYNIDSAGILLTNGAAPSIQNNHIDGGAAIGSGKSAGIQNDASSPVINNNTMNGGTGVTARGIYNLAASSPTISNNTIAGGYGEDFSEAIRNIDSSPTIENNSINGGEGFDTLGISTTNGAPIVHNNTIHGGTGSNRAFAVYNFNSTSTIENNEIYGGDNTNLTYAIHNVSSGTPDIRNNTIHTGSGSVSAYGISIRFGAAPSIDNNILMASDISSANEICIFEDTETSGATDPSSVRNNMFYDCTTLYWDNDNNCTAGNACTTVAEVHALSDFSVGASNNLATDPLLEDLTGTDNDISTLDDNDWRFSASSPGSVTSGGLNGMDQIPVWTFSTDKDGITRPASGSPWAIGAYEP